jgi:hypothetical protein
VLLDQLVRTARPVMLERPARRVPLVRLVRAALRDQLARTARPVMLGRLVRPVRAAHKETRVRPGRLVQPGLRD